MMSDFWMATSRSRLFFEMRKKRIRKRLGKKGICLLSDTLNLKCL